MANLFVTDKPFVNAIDAAMDVLPTKTTQVTLVLDLEDMTAVVKDTTSEVPEYLMKTPPAPATNTTGIRGVSKVKHGYRADITRNGKQTNLGTYDTLQDAVEARLVAQWGLV